MSNDLTIKSLHAVIDAHGVRRNAAIRTASRDTARDAAAALSDTKRGKADAYRIAVLALIAALSDAGSLLTGDTSKAARKRYVAAGKGTFSVDVAALIPEGLDTPKWNDGAALSMWIKRNAHRSGVLADNVVTLRDPEQGHHHFWVMVTG